MYRLSDLASAGAGPAWVLLAISAFDYLTRYDFIKTRIGGPVDISLLLAFAATVYLIGLVITGRIYRQKTADLLTAIWDYGLNNVLHRNVDSEKDFHQWLNRFGVWEADVLRTMHERHCTQQQRNDVANLHKFDVQAGLFHEESERNWWKSMMSAKIDSLAGESGVDV